MVTVSVTALAGIEVAARRRCRARGRPRHRRCVVSICRVPAGLVTAPVRLAALPAPSVTVAPLALTAVTARSAVFWPAADRVAEGQRAGAGAAAIGRGAAVVERQRRRAAATDRHRLAHVDRERDHAAGAEVAVAAVIPVPEVATDDTVGAVVSICSVPAGLVTAPVRLAALPAPSVTVARVQIDRRHRKVGRVLAGRHRIAEGQRAGAGTAGIGRRATVVERQRRRAAGDRHRLAQVDRERDHACRRRGRRCRCDAGARGRHRRHRRRRGVDLQRAGRVGHRAGEIGGIAGAVGDGGAVEH